MKKFSKRKLTRSIMLAGMVSISATAVAQPLSGVYTIDATQPSAGFNFNSFGDAVAALTNNGIAATVTFNVAAQIFNEQVIIPEISGASASNTITFNGNESTILFNSNNTAQRAVVKLDGADYVTIRNMAIKSTAGSASDYGYGVQLINGAEHNHIIQCDISVSLVFSGTPVTNFAGIVVNSKPDFIVSAGDANCNFNIIDSNIVSGGYHGISLVADGSTFQIRGNMVRGNKVLDFYNAGIYLNGNDGSVIENNDISRPNRSTSALFYGIQLYNISKNVRVEKNKIHDPFGGTSAYVTSGANGIYLVDAQANPGEENIIANNIIYNLKSNSVIRGIWLGNTTSGSVGSSYNKIIHNTISMDDVAFAGLSSSTGIESSGTAQNVTMQNNIISIKRVGSNFNTRIGLNSPSTNNTVDHNDIYIAAGSTNYFAKWGTANCTTLADWQNNSGDNSSVSEDPQFVDIFLGNLLPGNNALQAGQDINVTGVMSDINGLGRNAVPTMGAFEIGGVVLPVHMSTLKGQLDASNHATLYWNTFSEMNNEGFTVQTSTDGQNWLQSGFVASKALSGNSSEVISYTFSNPAKTEVRTFYRLKQTDVDQKSIYTNIITLQPGQHNRDNGLVVYPNPAGNVIKFTAGQSTTVTGMLIIADLSGKVLISLPGVNSNNEIDISSLPIGVYIVKWNSEMQVFNARFVKVK